MGPALGVLADRIHLFLTEVGNQIDARRSPHHPMQSTGKRSANRIGHAESFQRISYAHCYGDLFE
jgi:hypothetical protein